MGIVIVPMRISSNITQRIAKHYVLLGEFVWATLGYADDSPFDFEGLIYCSATGNLKSKGQAAFHVESMKYFELDQQEKNNIRELYIDLNQTSLIRPADLHNTRSKNLRLSLQFSEEYQALVYLQYSDHAYRSEDNDEQDDVIYVPPSRKKSTQSDYLFEVFTDGSKLFHTIKILLVKKKDPDDKVFLIESLSHLNTSEDEKYSLYNLLPDGNDAWNWQRLESLAELPEKGRGLLLIHGTFVKSKDSFESILAGLPDQSSFLHQLLNAGTYDYIVAYDHPTVLDSAKRNAQEFFLRYVSSNPFNLHLDLMATSRGCVVASYLLQLAVHVPGLHFWKIYYFSPAFGVKYLEIGSNLSLFLSTMARLSPTSAKRLIILLSTLAIDQLLALPGLDSLHPSNKELATLFKPRQKLNEVQLYNFVCTWDKSLYQNRVFRFVMSVLNKVIDILYKEKHDWVVGLSAQKMAPAWLNPIEIPLTTLHTRYLDPDFTLLHYRNTKQIHTLLFLLMMQEKEAKA